MLRQTLSTITVLLLLLLAACSRDDSVIVVGSKNFSENLLLAELIAQHIEANSDLTVERRLNLGGTFLCHQALVSGQLDIYPEYTGTALTAILKKPVEQDAEQVFETVEQAYRNQFDVEWTAPFGFNNTFAIVVRSEDAAARDLRTISDLSPIAENLVIGFNFEFLERQDGYPGLVKTYDLEFKQAPKTMDLGLVYRALRDGRIDVGVGNSTDGLISALNLRILEDNKNYFPPYDAAPAVRSEILEANPKLRDLLAELGGLLTEEEMQKYNYQIDGEHRPVPEVVRELRNNEGL